MKKAVIYARVSSISDRQNTDRQVVDLTRYAEYSEHNIIEIFEEKISGGKRNVDRPVLTECLNYCKDNNIDVLLVSGVIKTWKKCF